MAVRLNGNTLSSYGSAAVPSGDFTILCWAWLSVDRNTFSTLFTMENASVSSTNFVIVETGADGTTLNCYTTGSVVVGSIALTASTWYKVAVTVSGSTVTFYGAAAGQALSSLGSNAGGTFTRAQLYIGTNSFSEPWDGRVGNYKVYAEALSLAQVEAEFGQFGVGYRSNLSHFHPFRIAETTDYSGNGNTLTDFGGTIGTEGDPPLPGPPAQVADRGSVANATAATTSTVTLSNPTHIAVDNYLVARVAVDNSGTNGAAPGFTVTDPRSNSWTILGPGLADPGAAAAGATAYIGYAKVTTAYQAADALTFNWGGVSTTAKACVVEEWTNIDRATPVAVSAVTNDSVAAASTTAVAATIVPTGAGQLVYTCLATEGIAADTVGSDADTTNGSWMPLSTTASANATATNNQRVSGQFKVVTAAGSQTWNSTITSRDWAVVAVVFSSGPNPAPRRRPQLGALLQM